MTTPVLRVLLCLLAAVGSQHNPGSIHAVPSDYSSFDSETQRGVTYTTIANVECRDSALAGTKSNIGTQEADARTACGRNRARDLS